MTTLGGPFNQIIGPNKSLDNQLLNNNLILTVPVISKARVEHRYKLQVIAKELPNDLFTNIGVLNLSSIKLV